MGKRVLAVLLIESISPVPSWRAGKSRMIAQSLARPRYLRQVGRRQRQGLAGSDTGSPILAYVDQTVSEAVAIAGSISFVVVWTYGDEASSVVQCRSDAEVRQVADMPVGMMGLAWPPKALCKAASMSIDPARHYSIAVLPLR